MPSILYFVTRLSFRSKQKKNKYLSHYSLRVTQQMHWKIYYRERRGKICLRKQSNFDVNKWKCESTQYVRLKNEGKLNRYNTFSVILSHICMYNIWIHVWILWELYVHVCEFNKRLSNTPDPSNDTRRTSCPFPFPLPLPHDQYSNKAKLILHRML